MNRIFWFVAGMSVPFFMGATSQIADNISKSELTNIYRFIERPSFNVQTSTPTFDSMVEGQAIWVESNNALSLVTKGKKSRYYMNLTRIP